ncbi:MAG: hypothetical protein ABEJ75_01370 [Candidatus Nanohaloarchaea archaeon]
MAEIRDMSRGYDETVVLEFNMDYRFRVFSELTVREIPIQLLTPDVRGDERFVVEKVGEQIEAQANGEDPDYQVLLNGEEASLDDEVGEYAEDGHVRVTLD